MDPNLQFWSAEGKTFFRRYLHWLDILDPTLLLKSKNDIDDSRLLLQTNPQTLEEPLQNKRVKQAWMLSLSSVQPGTGEIILSVFRPPAFLPIVSPLLFSSLLPHREAKQTFIWQFLFYAYTAGFTLANGNATAKAEDGPSPQTQLLLTSGAIFYAACVGTFPNFALNRYGLNSPTVKMFYRRILPIPLVAGLSAFNVIIPRRVEYENGIEVMDKNGNVVGVSQKAGLKAVQETALSRAALFGTAVLLPDSLLYFIKRTHYLVRNPRALPAVRMILTFLALGMMLPVSFSIFPQLGKINRDDLETEILSSTEETELFYNRGV